MDEGRTYSYLKCYGSDFSSILGGFSIEGISRFELSPNYSKYLILLPIEFINATHFCTYASSDFAKSSSTKLVFKGSE